MVNPRLPWGVLVNILVVTGVDTCAGFRSAFEAPAPYTTVETCGASMRRFWSASGDSAPDAGITYKVNICKQCWFAVSYFVSPWYVCLVGPPKGTSTISTNQAPP